MRNDEAPAPEDVTTAADSATCSVESTSQPAAVVTSNQTSSDKAAKQRPANRGNTPLPKSLTPRVQNAIRLFSTGISAAEACKRSGVGGRYFHRVMSAPIGADYLKTITARIETTFVDKAASVAASENKLSVGQAVVQNEIDEAVLESVQELRSIVKTSKSDQARALAAKELLDLAQAKKRYMAAKGSQDTDIELSSADIAAFAQAAADIRGLHLIGTKEVVGEALNPEDASIIRTIEAAVDPEIIAAATAAVDQTSVSELSADENARPDGRNIDASPHAPVYGPTVLDTSTVNDPLGGIA